MKKPWKAVALPLLSGIGLTIGGLTLLVSLLLLGFAALGSVGALADAGPDENRKLALQFLSWGLPRFIGGLAVTGLSMAGLALHRRKTASMPSKATSSKPPPLPG